MTVMLFMWFKLGKIWLICYNASYKTVIILGYIYIYIYISTSDGGDPN